MRLKKDKDYANIVWKRLKKHYPKAKIVLNYASDFELLAAVILSAQTKDDQVNKATKNLFARYKTIKDYAEADLEEIQQAINSIGFYKNKAKFIKGSAQKILQEFGGSLPRTMEELTSLPGVARKTANIVLGNAYGIRVGVAVDTHVKRVSGRLRFSAHSQPEKIEKDLMELFEQKNWFQLTYLLIEHGRKICIARKPKCEECFLNDVCPSAFKFPHFKHRK